MSVPGVGSSSAYAEWMAYQIQMKQQQNAQSSCGSSNSADSISISQQGFAAMLQSQSAPEQPALTDDKAAEIGTRIQKNNPDLFKSLDANGDGTLSAQELTAGKDKIKDAHASEIGAKIEQANPDLFKALDTDKDGKLNASELKAGQDLLRGNGQAGAAGGASHHHHHHHHSEGGADAASTAQGTDQQSAPDPMDQLLQQLSSGSNATSSFSYNTMNDALQSLFSSAKN